jgi:hypothetical protein
MAMGAARLNAERAARHANHRMRVSDQDERLA